MKNKILKEFSEIFDNLKISNIQTTGLLLLISKVIAQTREETIREIREKILKVIREEINSTGDPFTDNMIDNTIIDYNNKIKSIIN